MSFLIGQMLLCLLLAALLGFLIGWALRALICHNKIAELEATWEKRLAAAGAPSKRDDLKVIETGEPMLEIVEIFMTPQGIPGWFLTNKLPVVAITGDVIGVMGTIQSYEGALSESTSPDASLAPALRYVGENFNREIPIPDLARRCDLSVRQFERKFKQHLKTTPQQFVIKTRVYAACDDLRRSRRSLASIATAMGFYDQAAFTRHFRKHMGMTPMQYRKQFR